MAKLHQKVKRKVDFSLLKKEKNKKWFNAIRDRIQAVELAHQGFSLVKIANMLGRSDSWVKKWIRRFNELGEKGLFSVKAKGQPLKLAPGSRGEQIIIDMLQNGPPQDSALCRYRVLDFQLALAQVDIIVSDFGIRAKLKNLGFSYKTNRPAHPKNDPSKMREWVAEMPKFIEEVKKNSRIKTKQLTSSSKMRPVLDKKAT